MYLFERMDKCKQEVALEDFEECTIYCISVPHQMTTDIFLVSLNIGYLIAHAQFLCLYI